MENTTKNYGESSAFVKRLNTGVPLKDARYSDSLAFVKKISRKDEMEYRKDLDENYVE